MLSVSPGLTAGGGLKLQSSTVLLLHRASFPRPHRRGRIETAGGPQAPPVAHVSPGLTAGGGLKRLDPEALGAGRVVSPGLTAGGGLKRSRHATPIRPPGFPRPHRRGRIETMALFSEAEARAGFPRPHRRGRIETWAVWRVAPRPAPVSPGLTAGGGLKRGLSRVPAWGQVVSPGLTAGGGLKRGRRDPLGERGGVSPGLTAGGGLKPIGDRGPVGFMGFPPASPPGAD